MKPASSVTVTVPPFDPPIEMGSYCALRRTDGKIAIVDTRRPLGDRTIRLVTNEAAARAVVTELGAQEWLASHR